MPRVPQNPLKVPPRVYGQLRVKDKILGGSSEKLAGICLSEMQQLFLCFRKYSFNQEACSKELASFKSCYDGHVKNFNEKANSKDLGKGPAELTKLLQRFPERKKDRY